MAIDPSIALKVAPLQIESPANMLSQVMQIRAAQQQEQFNAMRLAQAQREQQEMGRFNALMERGGATPQELIQTGQGRAALKSVGEAFKLEQEGRKEQRLAQQAQFKLGADQLGAVQQAFRGMSALPDTELTRDKVIARLLPLEQIGVPRSVIEATVAQVSDDPAANRREIETVLRAGMSPKDQSEAMTPRPQGFVMSGRVVQIDMNPNSPTFRQPLMITPEPPFTMTPGSTRFEGGRATVSTPFAPRPEAAAPAPSVTEVQDPTVPGQTLRVDARTYQGGGAGTPGVLGVSKPVGEELPLKERQKREAAFPKATQALRSFEDNADSMVKLITRLRNHPSLSAILGPIESRLPSVLPGATNAQSLFDQIMAKGSFQELQNMRSASPTGGALGNVSNYEVQQLRSAFAALNRDQSPEDFKASLDQAIASIVQSQARVKDAYDETYEYRSGPRQEAAPRGGATGDWSVVR